MRKNHFAALQKMALQLQTAREEHIQKQTTTPILPHSQPQPPQLQQQPTTPHHHSNPQTPHTPRYNQQPHVPDHHYPPQTPSSTRFLESTSTSTLRKYTNTNNAQFISSHHQQQSGSGVVGAPQQQHQHAGIMGSTVSIPPGYYTPGQVPQQNPAQPPRVCYDATGQRYYDAQVYDQRGQPVQNTPHHHVHGQPGYYAQQPQNPYYAREGTWGTDHAPGTTSRGASVKRRGTSTGTVAGMEPDMDPTRSYMIQQPGMGIPGSQVVQDRSAIYHHQQPNPPVQMQQTQVHVGSVIGTTSIEQTQPVQPAPGPPTGDKIRQLIPINPNQICGITPSDIDKFV